MTASRLRYLAGMATVLVLTVLAVRSPAEVTIEQRKELTGLKQELAKISTHIRKKEYDEAEQLLTDVESKAQAIATAASVELTDKSMLGIGLLIERNRKSLETAMARAGGKKPADAATVSFSKDVAPIVADKCLDCHGENPKGNLRLDTFAGWKMGGKSGPLLTVGNATRSLLIARLIAPNPQDRMPKNGDPLARTEVEKIAAWINAGAKYDGAAEDTPLADLGKAAKEADDPTVVIPKPTGKETVSFKRDIAPFVQNLCVRCHSGNNPRGGLSLVSFYDMMKGGQSGRVVLPGNVEGSRLFRLVGGLENPRMPQGQARITLDNYNNLKQWFVEGNAFDGPDPKAPLASYIQTEAAMEAEKFSKMSAEEFNKFRSDRSEEQWKRALPNDAFQMIQSDDLLVMGNVGKQRIEQVDKWAQDHIARLRKTFDLPGGQIWKGRLTVFLMKDRFGFDEFSQVIEGRRAAKEMTGYSVVKPNFEDAYLVLLDIGDDASAESPGLQVNLVDHLTGGFLRRSGNLPDWLVRGTGLALAAETAPTSLYFKNLKDEAPALAGSLPNPADVFVDGTFSPAGITPVSYTLVSYMIGAGGSSKFAQFIGQMQAGGDTATCVSKVYGADLQAVARGYLGSLGSKSRR